MPMTLSHHYQPGHFGLSYELFPPKTEKGLEALLRHVSELMRFRPGFITCTYGAGGSTQTKTLEICARVKREFEVPVASHLTLVGSTIEQLCDYLLQAQQHSVDYIVALRGDPPKGATGFEPVPGGLRYANELVELIRSRALPFGIAVAGYPETHQEAVSPDIDLENLKRKVDAGADIVVTQLFYNNADFYRFVDRCDAAGIHLPIIPGILPITDLGQIQRLTAMCGAKLPQTLVDRLGERDDPEWQFEQGVAFAIDQVQDLVEQGVPGMHFYVLNKSQATLRVLDSVALPAPFTAT